MDLTASEKRILKVALEAGRQRMSVEGVAERAKCTVEFLSKKLRETEFNQLFIETMQSSLLAETPEILAKFVEEAKDGSFKHGKLILEIAGVYSEKKKVDLSGKLEFQESPFDTPEERRKFLEATLAKSVDVVEESEVSSDDSD